MPNTFAHLMLLGWPLVTLVLFMRLPVPLAATVSIVAGYLLLPTRLAFDAPLLPPYDRDLAAVLPALVMAAIRSRSPAPGARAPARPAPHMLEGWLPRDLFARICVLAIVGGAVMTSLTNTDPLVYGDRVLPGLGLYEAASAAMITLVGLLPFFVARKWLAHPGQHAMLLAVLCIAALAYSLPALYEVRMSPQLNVMVYGFFPHSWVQHFRGGGYRPVVFLTHALELGIFLAIALIATAGLLRILPTPRKMLLAAAALWIFGTLVLCKTLGPLILAVTFVPLVLVLGARIQIMIAALMATTVLLYPTLRGADLVPTDRLLTWATQVGSLDRAASLNTRFTNEDRLLAKANERPVFGWGRFGRSRVYDEEGRDVSITDGAWVIFFGDYGWVGYLARFGLLTVPIVLLMLRRRRDLDIASATLCLALAANLVDLLPNSSLSPITWMMAGAVAGRLELGRIRTDAPETEAVAPVQASPYRRTLRAPAPPGTPAMPERPTRAAYRRSQARPTYCREKARGTER